MHSITIIWALVCAAIIAGYPIYLLRKSAKASKRIKQRTVSRASNTIELLSFDLRGQLPSWSVSLDVPQITEEIICHCPILFYLETEDTCLKLPINNQALGYTANVYKNTGKVYLTFKCLVDGVSNFHVPAWHITNLKVLIVKPRNRMVQTLKKGLSYKTQIQTDLQRANINLNDYEEVLIYFSNRATLEFKGHFITSRPSRLQAVVS
ncbi:MAG: hypothetical protein AAF969_00740 [Bacteroidota bacterium]